MLWLCIYLPLLPLEAFELPTQSDTVVAQNQKVLLANESAKARGISTNLTISTARALSQELMVIERDIEKEQQQLQTLAESLYCYSPDIICYSNSREQHSLLLEIGRSLKLFGGAEKIQQQIHHQLRQHSLHPEGFTHQFAISSTVKAAELLARYNWLRNPKPQKNEAKKNATLDTERQKEPIKKRLGAIPIELLDTKEKNLQHCQSMGIDSLSKLIQLPKATLKKRFDSNFNDHIDKLLGETIDLHHFIQLPTTFSQEQYYVDGIHNHANLIPTIKQLLNDLCIFLQTRQLQVISFRWRFVRFSKKANTLEIAFSEPQHQHSVLFSLTELKLDQIPLDSPIECVQLNAYKFKPWLSNTHDFFTQQSKPTQSFAVLADTLSSKLGPAALAQVQSVEQHIPEIANQLIFFSAGLSNPKLNNKKNKSEKKPPLQNLPNPRPDWLLAAPERLQKKGHWLYRQHQPMTLLSGPERIEGFWWQCEVSRDYYIAAEKNGTNVHASTCQQFYWIYQNRKNKQWYLHGVFA